MSEAIVIHLVCDWLLQNDWMARNKANVRHIAGYMHATIHGVGLLLIFPWHTAFVLAALHFWIDTRTPLIWWRRVFRQTTEGPAALHVAIWGDQVAHILCIAMATRVLQ